MNKPTLLLLPGMDGTGVLFKPLLDALPVTLCRRVICYPPKGEQSYNTLVDWLLPSITQPVVVLGESFSGPMAISLAAHLTEQVKGVILCASFAKTPNPLTALARHVPGKVLKAAADAVGARILFGRLSTSTLRRQFNESLQHVSGAVLQQRIKQIDCVNVRGELQELTCPILYLQGRRDYLVRSPSLKYIQAAQPNVQVERFDAPHGLLQTHPALAAQVIVRFMETIQ